MSHNFLTSHAYLKDSAAEIRGSQLASPVHSRSSQRTSETLATKRAIQGALEQAVLAPDDIQIVELRYGSNQSAQLALGELKVAEDGHASPISHPFIGSTGLAGVCELGQYAAKRKHRSQSYTNLNSSLATPWLDSQQISLRGTKLPSVHDGTGRHSIRDSHLSSRSQGLAELG